MTDQVPKTWLSGFWKCLGEMGLRQVERGLSSIFGEKIWHIFVDLRQWGCCKALKKIIISQKKSSKRWRKALFNLLYTHFFGWFRITENPISGTRSVTSNAYTYTSPHEAVHFILNQGMDGICVTQLTQIGFCHDLAIWRTLLAKQYFSMLSKLGSPIRPCVIP